MGSVEKIKASVSDALFPIPLLPVTSVLPFILLVYTAYVTAYVV